MVFRISRLRVVAADDAGFSDLVSALPDGAESCLYCGRRSRDSLAMVLAADESDDNPLTLFTVICSKCSTLHPTDQLLTDWADRLAERRCPSDSVQWQEYVRVSLREPANDQAEIDIAGRVYRVQRSELGPVGP